MFGDVDVDSVLYSAALQVVQTSTINAPLRKLKAHAGPDDEDAVRRGRDALDRIGEQLDKIEADLRAAARDGKHLSKQLAATDRARIVESLDEQAAERHREAGARARAAVDDAIARAGVESAGDTTTIADRVAVVAAGYDEARQVSHGVLRTKDGSGAASPPTVLKTVWKLFRSMAGSTDRF